MQSNLLLLSGQVCTTSFSVPAAVGLTGCVHTLCESGSQYEAFDENFGQRFVEVISDGPQDGPDTPESRKDL